MPDVSADPRFAKRIDEMTKMETQSIICVPLRSKHRVLGVIQLVNVDMEGFKDGELFFLHSLVRLCGDRDRKCAGGRENPGTDDHRRLHGTVQRATSV